MASHVHLIGLTNFSKRFTANVNSIASSSPAAFSALLPGLFPILSSAAHPAVEIRIYALYEPMESLRYPRRRKKNIRPSTWVTEMVGDSRMVWRLIHPAKVR